MIKSSLYSQYAPKRVLIGGAHLRGFAAHSSEQMLQRWQAVGESNRRLLAPIACAQQLSEPSGSEANDDKSNRNSLTFNTAH